MIYCRHLKKEHTDFTPETTESKDKDKKNVEDYKFNYHKAKMRFGLMLFDINDAIREGNGNRLVCLYQLALFFYICYGHT